MTVLSKSEAQQRVDGIHVFRTELSRLQRDGILAQVAPLAGSGHRTPFTARVAFGRRFEPWLLSASAD